MCDCGNRKVQGLTTQTDYYLFPVLFFACKQSHDGIWWDLTFLTCELPYTFSIKLIEFISFSLFSHHIFCLDAEIIYEARSLSEKKNPRVLPAFFDGRSVLILSVHSLLFLSSMKHNTFIHNIHTFE